jgi:hypothetical protein
LEVPHFRQSLEINVYVELLPSCIHGEKLWLESPMSIDTPLIVWIIGLPKVGEDPTIFFNKAGEKSLSKSMKEKFHTFRGKRGLVVMKTNGSGVFFAMQVLACKLLCT